MNLAWFFAGLFVGGVAMGAWALVSGLTDSLAPAPAVRVELYRDAGGGWRWRAVARNHEIVAVSGESYSTTAACRRAVRALSHAGLAQAFAEAAHG